MIQARKPRPVPAVIGVVFHEGRVLLARRPDTPGARKPDAGKWGFPGGKIEWGESIEQAAEREIMEETGLTVKAGPVIGAVDFMDVHENGRLRTHYVLIAALCRWIEGQAEPADDVTEAAWFMPEECVPGKLPMSRNVPELIRAALNAGAE